MLLITSICGGLIYVNYLSFSFLFLFLRHIPRCLGESWLFTNPESSLGVHLFCRILSFWILQAVLCPPRWPGFSDHSHLEWTLPVQLVAHTQGDICSLEFMLLGSRPEHCFGNGWWCLGTA